MRLLQSLLRLEANYLGDVRESQVAAGDQDLLEFMIGQAALRLQTNIAEGVPRRYAEKRETTETIRGRIALNELSRLPPGGRVRVPVTHSPLQRDNDLSRLLRAVARELFRLSRSARHRRVLGTCEAMLWDVGSVPLSRKLLDRASPSRLEEEWRWVIQLAESLFLNRLADPTRAGEHESFSVLFSLHGLFERAVRRSVKRALSQPLSLSSTKSIGYLLESGSGGPSFMNLQPDLIIQNGAFPYIIGDAKWRERKGASVGRIDAYQMVTYMAHTKAKRGFLIQPSAAPLDGIIAVTPFHLSSGQGALFLFEIDAEKLCADVNTRSDAVSKALGEAISSLAAHPA